MTSSSWLRAGLIGLMLTSPSLAKEPAATGAKPEFTPLFNGKNLDGWKKVGGEAVYRIEGDDIVGMVIEGGTKANTFLRTEKTYGDFVLKVECKLDVPSNSGIQFRSHQRADKKGNGRVYGYQCEIDPSGRKWTAGIYDEGNRGWLFPLTGKPKAQEAFKLTEWNSFVIEARGPWLKTTLNGVPCADLLDAEELEGFIALQVHSAKEGQIRWRNIFINDMGTRTWTPIFNGKNLDGWHAEGGGKWTVSNGVLHGSSAASESRHGHLVFNKPVGDFAVRLKYKDAQGNSGLYFRAKEGGQYGIVGFQAEIDPANDVGGLYETDGRGWVVQPKPDDVKKAIGKEEWRRMDVIAIGNRVAVHVNGHRTAEVTDDKIASEGVLALQLHGGQDMDISFKEIEMLDLSDLKTASASK